MYTFTRKKWGRRPRPTSSGDCKEQWNLTRLPVSTYGSTILWYIASSMYVYRKWAQYRGLHHLLKIGVVCSCPRLRNLFYLFNEYRFIIKWKLHCTVISTHGVSKAENLHTNCTVCCTSESCEHLGKKRCEVMCRCHRHRHHHAQCRVTSELCTKQFTLWVGWFRSFIAPIQ